MIDEVLNLNKSLDQLSRESDYIIKARNMRKGVRPNYDKEGNRTGESSHQMSYAEVDGKYIVFPTLFQNKDGKWIEDYVNDKRLAFEEAVKRDEIFVFQSEEDASEFAKGSWKSKNE